MDYRELFFLRSLREADVLDALVTAAGTPEELAAETAVSPEVARFILQTLSALGYLTEVEGQYEPTNELLGILTTRDVRSIGTLPASLDDADRLVALSTRFTGTEAPEEQSLVNSLGAAAARDRATVKAVGTAVLRASPKPADALVLNEAPGRLAVDLSERGIDVTLVDHPTALDRSEGIVAGSAVTAMPTIDWEGLPTSELVVAAPGFRRDPLARTRLLRAASSAVVPDGHVVFVDRYHEDDGGDPLDGVMDVARTGTQRDRSLSTLHAAFDQEGLTVEAIDSVPGTEFVAVRGCSRVIE